MRKIQRSALLMKPAELLYRLVNEVENYPTFIDGCVGTEVIERSDTEQKARLYLSKAGIKLSFTTHNHMVINQSISLDLLDGPFNYLHGEWRFIALREDACKVEFDLEFDLNNSLLGVAAAKVLDSVSSNIVDALCQKANQQ
jgi:ribosome-associated toxin RatA of RatAB toxin-antitoxin module